MHFFTNFDFSKQNQMDMSWSKELGFYSKYNGESPQCPHLGVSWCDLVSMVWDDSELHLFRKALD